MHLLLGNSELGKRHGAPADDKAEILSPALLVKEEVLFADDAEPIKELKDGLDELERLKSPIAVGCLVLVPDQSDDCN